MIQITDTFKLNQTDKSKQQTRTSVGHRDIHYALLQKGTKWSRSSLGNLYAKYPLTTGSTIRKWEEMRSERERARIRERERRGQIQNNRTFTERATTLNEWNSARLSYVIGTVNGDCTMHSAH